VSTLKRIEGVSLRISHSSIYMEFKSNFSFRVSRNGSSYKNVYATQIYFPDLKRFRRGKYVIKYRQMYFMTEKC